MRIGLQCFDRIFIQVNPFTTEYSARPHGSFWNVAIVGSCPLVHFQFYIVCLRQSIGQRIAKRRCCRPYLAGIGVDNFFQLLVVAAARSQPNIINGFLRFGAGPVM